MIAQFISAVCTISLMILAILIMTKAISLEDAVKAILKGLLALVVLYIAICSLAPPLVAGVTALARVLKAALVWLTVTVIVATLLILFIRVILLRLIAQMNARRDPDRGEP